MKKVLGIILLPVLYARYQFVFGMAFAHFFVQGIPDVKSFFLCSAICWFFISLFYAFLMGNFELMKYWANMWARIVRLKYKRTGTWTTGMIHSFSAWDHPTIQIEDKSYDLSVAAMGGNTYEADANITRKAIFIYLFNH